MINLVTIVLSVGNNLLFLGANGVVEFPFLKGRKRKEVVSHKWMMNLKLRVWKSFEFVYRTLLEKRKERERGGSRRGIFEVWEEIWSAIIDRIATKSINYKVILYGTESRGGRIFIKVFHRSIRHPMMQSTFPSIMQDVSY